MSDTWVKCVNCAYHSVLFGKHWCDGRKKSLRLTAEDAIIDAPCTYYKPKEVNQMRLIDADALWMEVIRRMDYCDDILEMIESQPTIEPEQRWIPVSERMPEPRIDVWCNSDMGQIVGYYEENVETWYGRDYLELMVTAWMPLPEPYGGEHDG